MSTPVAVARRERRFFALAIGLVILGLGIYRSFLLPETDTLWQVRAGIATLNTGHIPQVETWDWLIAEHDWLPNSWLWNVLVAIAYQAGGLIGLAVLNLLLFVGLLTLAWVLLRQLHVNPAFQFIAVFLLAVVMVPWVTLRPQEIDYMLLLVFFIGVARLREVTRPRMLLFLPLLAFVVTVAWMNLHLTATAALAFFPLAYLLLAHNVTWRTWRAHVLPALLIMLAVTLGLFITPFGLIGILKTIAVAGASHDVIIEWQALNFGTSIAPITLLGLAVGGLAPVIYTTYKRRWLLAGSLAALTILSYNVIRFTPYLIIFSLLSLVLLPAARQLIRHAVSYVIVAATIMLLGVPLLAGAVAQPTGMLTVDPTTFDTIPHNSRVLTLPVAGGAMLLFRPDLSPAVDGRNDLFGTALYSQIVGYYYNNPHVKTLAWLDQQRVNAVYFNLAEPASSLSGALRAAGWVEHKTASADVFLRPGL